MSETRDLLVEIGTEELPPKALKSLSKAFGRELCASLHARGLGHGEASGLVLVGIGEGALHVTEQFRFGQAVG